MTSKQCARFPIQYRQPRTFLSMETLYIKRNQPRPHSSAMQPLQPRPTSPFVNTATLPPIVEKSLVQTPDILQISQNNQKPIIYFDDEPSPRAAHKSQILDQIVQKLVRPEDQQLSVVKVQKSRSRAVSAARKRAAVRCQELEVDALRELTRMKINEFLATK